MRYSEDTLPDKLKPFVSAIWRMEASGSESETLERKAVPDGCIELIRRKCGQSSWNTPQPEKFVAGLCSAPATLTMSGSAVFEGVRLWPWAWNMLGHLSCRDFHDRWIPVDKSTLAEKLLCDGYLLADHILEVFSDLSVSEIGKHVPVSNSPGELVERTGRSHRSIQRWFKQEIGLPPRQYFRLLRFQNAVRDEPDSSIRQAEKAAGAGYADQAHMTRDFRRFSGETPGRLQQARIGPFVKSPES